MIKRWLVSLLGLKCCLDCARPDPDPAPGQARIARADHRERLRVRAAARRATLVYPGPVGELLARELWAWEELGWRMGDHGLIGAVVEDIERRRRWARG